MYKDKKQIPEEVEEPKEGGSGPLSALGSSGSLYDAAGNLGFGQRLGTPISLLPSTNQKNAEAVAATVDWIPMFGVSADASTVVSQMGEDLYRRIGDAQHRSSLPYTSADIAMHIMCLASLHAAYNWVGASLSSRKYSNPYTRVVNNPRMYQLYGWDPVDFSDNASKIAMQLGEWEAALAAYPLPKSIPMFAIQHQLTTCIHMDDNDPAKAQLYIFRPSFLWSWEDTDTTLKLKPISFLSPSNPTGLTWASVKAKINAMFKAAKDSAGFNDINAGITSLGSEAGVMPVPHYDMEQPPVLVYDEHVLNSLHNAIPVGITNAEGITPYTTALPGVRTPGIINQGDPAYEGSERFLGAVVRRYIAATVSTPTSKDLVEYLRWHPIIEKELVAGTNGEYNLNIMSCGTELINSVSVWSYDDSVAMIKGTGTGSTDYNMVCVPAYATYDGSCIGEPYKLVKMLAATKAFRHFPGIAGKVWAVDAGSDPIGEGVDVFTNYHFLAAAEDAFVTQHHEALLWHSILNF